MNISKLILMLLIMTNLSCGSYGQTTTSSFTLQSKTLGGNASQIEEFDGFGCTGKNQSPQLSWMNAPEGTKSFAITMFDPDAPTGSGWWHWVVFDIPADINELVANAGDPESQLMPKDAIQSTTDYGQTGYGGPCPPENHGLHRYIITIHALKTDKLGLNETTNPAVVGYYLWQNTIAKASIMTYYKREK